MTTDRNSEAVATVVAEHGFVHGLIEWLTSNKEPLPNGTKLYTTPPASIPVAGLEALVERWRAIAHELRYNPAAMPRTAHHYETCADELAQLIQEAK